MKTKNSLPKIGTWGFIIGDKRISEEKWKESFPSNFFGKVIGYITKFNRKQLIIRCYRKNKNGKVYHPHLYVEKKYFTIDSKNQNTIP